MEPPLNRTPSAYYLHNLAPSYRRSYKAKVDREKEWASTKEYMKNRRPKLFEFSNAFYRYHRAILRTIALRGESIACRRGIKRIVWGELSRRKIVGRGGRVGIRIVKYLRMRVRRGDSCRIVSRNGHPFYRRPFLSSV